MMRRPSPGATAVSGPSAGDRFGSIMLLRGGILLAISAGIVLAWVIAGPSLPPGEARLAHELDAVEPAAGGDETARMPDLLAVASKEIEERQVALDQREQDLAAREEALRGLARRLQAELAELQALRQERDAEQARVAREDEERILRLARLYETMKPKRAASIFDQSPVDEVASIARRMRDGKAALVIQQMAPERASAVTARLSEP
jgi:flagellar motility protein MotE (MotC chaperone)